MKLKEGLEISSGDFWYDLSLDGYLDPDEMIEDPKIAEKVKRLSNYGILRCL